MFNLFFHKKIIFILFTAVFVGSFFIFNVGAKTDLTAGYETPPVAADLLKSGLPENEIKTTLLKDYIAYFYNRYARHFDEHGLVFKTPAYGVEEFRPPETAREILSLNLYYKYHAMAGERAAREKLRAAILSAEKELSSRPLASLSFSDGFAEMATLNLLDQVPFLLTADEESQIYSSILKRLEPGTLAADTSNRAALGAVYWQLAARKLHDKKLISDDYYTYLSRLIYQKIKTVLAVDVENYWYKEGEPRRFNPHYHMITALAFLSYYEASGEIEFYLAAKKMTDNLRAVSFANGMVEALLGERPVGLGAQFYLGTGLLNYYFGYGDCGVYFNYAAGDRLFSDPAYPDRLEYHYTLEGRQPGFHDDVSFSNLAELALNIKKFRDLNIVYADRLSDIPEQTIGPDLAIKNYGLAIIFNNQKYSLVTETDKVKIDYYNYSAVGQPPQPEVIYGREIERDFGLEVIQGDELNHYLKSRVSRQRDYRLSPSWPILLKAYVYGGYSLAEIADTVINGPAAVHPFIPAASWRKSDKYREYVSSMAPF